MSVNPLFLLGNDGTIEYIWFYNLLVLICWENTAFLKTEHGVTVTLSTLQRYLILLGFFRQKAQSDVLDVTLFYRSS